MKLIQELLGIIERKETVKTLIANRDWFELGRLQSSNVSSPSYTPKMQSHGIRFDDLLAQIISNIPSITLTTTGSSGPATFINNVLNIPQYASNITLTTTGTSGPATLTNNVLNIPQYAGLTYTAGTGLQLSGNVFSLALVPTASASGSFYLQNGGLFSYLESITLNSFGQITQYNTKTVNTPELLAGAGITLTPNFNPTSVSTITISATGVSSPNAWYNIAVANGSPAGGSSTIVPDAVQDTLTFAGGTGIEVSTLDTGGTLDRVVIRNTGVTSFGGSTGAISVGSGLNLTGGTLTATGGSGTVTSVGLIMPVGFSVSNSPVTTSGILNVQLTLGSGVVGVCSGDLSILNLSGLTFNNSTCTLTADPAPIQSIIAGTGITVQNGTGPNVTVSSSVVSCIDNKYDTYNMVIAKGNDPTIVSLTGVALGFKATVANLEYNLVLTLSYQGANGNTNYTETHVSMPVHFRKSSTSGTNVTAPFTPLVQWDDYVFIPHEDTGRSATRTYSWTVKNLALNEAISIWVGGTPAYTGNGDIKVKKANLSITVASCEAFSTNIAPITVA